MADYSIRLSKIPESKKEYGSFFLRFVIGWRLIAGAWLAISIPGNMSGVKDFFEQLNLPFPLISAYASVYAQFICGILFIIGLWVRPAALVMVINFIVAIAMYDIHYGIEKAFPAWAILAGSLFFLLNGGGKFSADKVINTMSGQSSKKTQ